MQLATDGKTNQVRVKRTLGVFLVLGLLAWSWATPAADLPSETTSICHTVISGDTLIKICSQYRSETNHYSLTDLLNDIRRANDLQSNLLQIGQKLTIPIVPPGDFLVTQAPVQAGNEVRGIYLTGPACGVSTVWQRVDRFIEAGGNAVVFDAKDIDGGVSFHSSHHLANWGKGRAAPLISSLPDMMNRFDKRGLYVIARVALFLDGELGKQRPDLALPDAEGNPWTERGCTWIDAADPEVRDYNLTLAVELAKAGVDEIQFDYVRFPTNGWREDWAENITRDLTQVAANRQAVITDFLTVARDSLSGYGVKISADLYGIMAWGRMEDLALTGQHVPSIATLVDVICPMIYPSHFGPGFEGRRRPGDDPEYFIGEGTRRFVDQVAGQAEIRPWLQAFPYRVSNYDGQYITTQVVTSRNAGGSGWCLWNPACSYQVALAVLPGLCGDGELEGAAAAPVVAVIPVGPAVGLLEAPAVLSVDPKPVLHRDSPATLLGALIAAEEAGPVPPPVDGGSR